MALCITLLGAAGLVDRFVLLSHGSRRPEAWAQLDALARELQRAAEVDVVPSAVFFGADGSAGGTGGCVDGAPPPPPASLDVALRRMLEADAARPIGVLPFVLGPSRALRVEAPRIIRGVLDVHPAARVELLPCLSHALGGDGIRRASRGLADQVQRLIATTQLVRPRVYVCDHGSADAAVAAVRRALAARVAHELGGAVCAVEPAPMERPAALVRGGVADDPLLEERLAALDDVDTAVVVAMAFVSPGRHAGAEGDVASIVRLATAARPQLVVHVTGLLGDAPAARAILADSILQLRRARVAP
ncbi:hypothetical protein KFE25_010256 [Diacronema lutheri]|uniref:Sirohydrochlorin cobaltochelatase n=3 Tax=Diacronema lutheri TaxID=2081491 RepID=A0A8J6CES5_DIALT|nr:hypothetical protein KFE25_010256 [Diacronema lutheri]